MGRRTFVNENAGIRKIIEGDEKYAWQSRKSVLKYFGNQILFFYSEWYPRGRRGSPAKGVGGQKPCEGSNPSHSAKESSSTMDELFLNNSGELSERFKEPVLKTGDSERNLGFESLTLRHNRYRNWYNCVGYGICFFVPFLPQLR